MKKKWPFLLLVFVAELSVDVASAQDREAKTVDESISLVSQEPISNSSSIIDGRNSKAFKELIIPELYPLVKSGAFPIATERELPEKVRFLEGEKQEVPVTRSGLLREGISLGKGFIAGGQEEIAKEEDKSYAAWKILWNVQSNNWRYPVLRGDFSLTSVRGDVIGKELSGSLERVYPSLIPEGGKSAQFFREKLSFKTPPVIDGLSWLTFRFLGADEDMVWIYSPAIKKERQLTGSNRGDPVIGTSISLDDFLGWSGKTELVDPSVNSSGVYLAPFSSLSPTILKGELEPPCIKLHPDVEAAGSRFANWNFEEGRHPNAARWAPISGVYVPREMWVLELIQRDPYSRYGRQVLYVDKELMIPFYKIVYDRAGKFIKLVISYFGYWGTEGEEKIYAPFVPYSVIKDDDRAVVDLFEFRSIELCTGFPDGKALSDFDPRKLLPAELPAK